MTENYVFKAIVGFLRNECSPEIEVVSQPDSIGLIVQRQSKWLATSVDGIIELKYIKLKWNLYHTNWNKDIFKCREYP